METFLVIWPFSQNDILPIAGFLGVPLAVFILSYKYKLIEKITKKNSFKKTQKHKPMENTVSKTPTLKSVCFELKSIWKRTLLAKYFAKIITETKEYKSPEKKVVSAAQQVDAVITDGETTKKNFFVNQKSKKLDAVAVCEDFLFYLKSYSQANPKTDPKKAFILWFKENKDFFKSTFQANSVGNDEPGFFFYGNGIRCEIHRVLENKILSDWKVKSAKEQ